MLVGAMLSFAASLIAEQEGTDVFGKFEYADFERPEACRQCHVDFYYQWQQSLMSQSYVHHWDEIEYFKLALPHAEQDPSMAGVRAGCNGCHAPLSYMAGDVPPPHPEEGSRANEGVSCEVCHLITGRTGEISVNHNYTINPGKVKRGNRDGVQSPHHTTEYSEFIRTAEFCGMCHNEKNDFGMWVKSTQLEWEEGPYGEEGVVCQECHMPRAATRNANTAKEEHPDVALHLFHGAHDPGKLAGAVEVRMHPGEREAEPGDRVVINVQLFNGKCGHKIPSGSSEERQLWLRVEAVDAQGRSYHLPVDRKGFEGEDQTITSNQPAYQDIGEMVDHPGFAGLPRDSLPEGDRIFCLPYLDPQGRRTIAQWNTKSFGPDYRIGPRETRLETFTWTVPDDIPLGRVVVRAQVNYRRLVKSVADYLQVPEDETEIVWVNQASTWFEVVD